MEGRDLRYGYLFLRRLDLASLKAFIMLAEDT